MEEKKLTDEEELVVKLETMLLPKFQSIEYWDVPRKDVQGYYNVIHRLQSELKKELDEHEEFTKKANAEIKRLTEENLKYSIERGKILAEKDDIGLRLKEKQKQVDELQDRLASVLVGIKADELLVAKGIEQAVKDTAKEIFMELLDFVNGWFEGVEYNDFGVEFNRISKDLAEKYGVEVE